MSDGTNNAEFEWLFERMESLGLDEARAIALRFPFTFGAIVQAVREDERRARD